MFKKNRGKLRLSDVLSNAMFELTLNDLDWIHSENSHSAWEVLKIKELEKESIFLAIMLRSLTSSFKFGSFTYVKRGVDTLERTSPLITKQRKENKLFKITKEVKKTLSNIVNEGPKGVIIK